MLWCGVRWSRGLRASPGPDSLYFFNSGSLHCRDLPYRTASSRLPLRELAEACLSSDPRARPTAPELVGRLRALLAESGALQVGLP